MGKVEKYYQFIVNDLLKNTFVDKRDRVHAPYIKGKNGMGRYDFIVHCNNSPNLSWFKDEFDDYVKEKYGAGDKDISQLWYMYSNDMVDRL